MQKKNFKEIFLEIIDNEKNNGLSEEIYIKASKVKAIDTTGAGDAFNGGFSVALLEGKEINECLYLANRIAGLSTTRLGAGDSMPTLNELILNFIKKSPTN